MFRKVNICVWQLQKLLWAMQMQIKMKWTRMQTRARQRIIGPLSWQIRNTLQRCPRRRGHPSIRSALFAQDFRSQLFSELKGLYWFHIHTAQEIRLSKGNNWKWCEIWDWQDTIHCFSGKLSALTRKITINFYESRTSKSGCHFVSNDSKTKQNS